MPIKIFIQDYYTDLKVGSEIKIGGDYWLYKPNATWPNSGTTNFVESVRVILGGGGIDEDGKIIQFWNTGNSGQAIGSITCQ